MKQAFKDLTDKDVFVLQSMGLIIQGLCESIMTLAKNLQEIKREDQTH